MTSLPTSTITFLFTDIEGSTRLWEEHSDAMHAALARHDALVRQAIESNHGFVFKTVGDAFHAAFQTAPDAVAAALAAQRALNAERWGETPIKVRMALLTGVAEERDGDYFGPPLNWIARLLASGHGNQVLLSQATYELVRRDRLPESVTLRDLGEHHLKDLIRPEHIYQLVASDLPSEFPPLKTLDTLPNNLPIQLTSFIGREREIAEIKRLLSTTRLLTLTGAGGSGKTRLSLQAAADLLDEFKDGVWFIELAPLTDPALVPQTIASALGLRNESAVPMLDVLKNYSKEKNLLLVLDNCEHLIEACAKTVDALLHHSPRIKILATSREALNIAGETAFRVPSLAVPDLQKSASINDLKQSESVRLFVERAHAAASDFQLNDANTRTIAQICQRLDGMPLAIELAAARVNTISVEEIAARLDNRFRLLTGGSRTALPRQQTLRALIDWSFDLLSEPERVLLRQLAVFAGGFTLDAVESVCAEENKSETLDLLSQLVQKSLVVSEQSGKSRYRLLETVREYALAKLHDAGEIDLYRTRHLDYFLKFAEEIEPHFREPGEEVWLNVLEVEHDNLRAAFHWGEESSKDEAVLRLAWACYQFWNIRGYLYEARERFAIALALPGANDPRLARLRARVLFSAAIMARFQTDYAAANPLARASLAIFRMLGDSQGTTNALMEVGLGAWGQGDYVSARSYLLERLAICKETGDRLGIAMALLHLGIAERELGNYAEGRRLIEQSLKLHRDLGFDRGIAQSLMHLGSTAIAQRDPAASSILEEGLELYRRVGDKHTAGKCLHDLGQAAAWQGDHKRARAYFEESLILLREFGDRRNAVKCVEGLAGIAVAYGRIEQAARLFGASEAVREKLGTPLPASYRANYDSTIAALAAQIDEERMQKLWDEGRAMTYEQAIEYALAEPTAGALPTSSISPHDPNALTPREMDVLRLVAAGLSNARIAEKLVISPRTVNTHLGSIYSKLGVNTRSAATRYAVDHNLT